MICLGTRPGEERLHGDRCHRALAAAQNNTAEQQDDKLPLQASFYGVLTD